MITENRLTAYINSLDQGDGELIEQIAETAVKNRVPIIRRETAALLKTMVTLVSPARILEVGTAVGYSALLMASVMPENCRITTIEKYEKRIPEAKENFRLAGMEEKITLLEGDAGEILSLPVGGVEPEPLVVEGQAGVGRQERHQPRLGLRLTARPLRAAVEGAAQGDDLRQLLLFHAYTLNRKRMMSPSLTT